MNDLLREQQSIGRILRTSIQDIANGADIPMGIDPRIPQAVEDWEDAQTDGGCQCPNGNPPCSFCTNGFSLPLVEYLEAVMEEIKGEYEYVAEPVDDATKDYDRAMKGLF